MEAVIKLIVSFAVSVFIIEGLLYTYSAILYKIKLCSHTGFLQDANLINPCISFIPEEISIVYWLQSQESGEILTSLPLDDFVTIMEICRKNYQRIPSSCIFAVGSTHSYVPGSPYWKKLEGITLTDSSDNFFDLPVNDDTARTLLTIALKVMEEFTSAREYAQDDTIQYLNQRITELSRKSDPPFLFIPSRVRRNLSPYVPIAGRVKTD